MSVARRSACDGSAAGRSGLQPGPGGLYSHSQAAAVASRCPTQCCSTVLLDIVATIRAMRFNLIIRGIVGLRSCWWR